MEKWADYVITAVRYNKDRDHIEAVKIREDLGDKFGDSSDKERKYIVDLINNNKKIITVVWDNENKVWKKGSKVDIYEKKYIRTDPNGTTKDNLGEIDEF